MNDKMKFLIVDILDEYRMYLDDEYQFSPEEFLEKYLKNELPRPIDHEIAEWIKNNEI